MFNFPTTKSKPYRSRPPHERIGPEIIGFPRRTQRTWLKRKHNSAGMIIKPGTFERLKEKTKKGLILAD